MNNVINKKRKVALFDICHTLIWMTTISDFTEHFLLSPKKNKNFKLVKFIYHFIFKVFRKLKIINNEIYRKHYIKLLKGFSEKEIASISEVYFYSRLKNSFKKEIVDKLNYFKSNGYEIFLVSAGFDIYLNEFSKMLGAKLICTIADKNKNGIYTGKTRGLDCFAENKVNKIKEEISFYSDVDWDESFAFSDDISDAPMLSLVGNKYVVDPSAVFEKYAQENNWKIIKTGFLSPYNKKNSYFVIRDDDLSYFSSPKDIEFWYKDLFLENIPVSFSVIPFVKNNSDVYVGELSKNIKEHPIGENIELVNYLNKNNNIEILQHGCTHETINGIFEFKRNEGLFKEIRRGNEYLKKIFGSVDIFVAPHDSISNHGIKAVESVGLNIIRSKGFYNFVFRYQYLIGIIRMILHRIKYINRYIAPAYPYVIDLGLHKEVYSNRIIKDKELLKKWLNFSIEKNSHFVVVTHLHYFDNEIKEILLYLINEAKNSGFSFVKASELFK